MTFGQHACTSHLSSLPSFVYVSPQVHCSGALAKPQARDTREAKRHRDMSLSAWHAVFYIWQARCLSLASLAADLAAIIPKRSRQVWSTWRTSLRAWRHRAWRVHPNSEAESQRTSEGVNKCGSEWCIRLRRWPKRWRSSESKPCAKRYRRALSRPSPRIGSRARLRRGWHDCSSADGSEPDPPPDVRRLECLRGQARGLHAWAAQSAVHFPPIALGIRACSVVQDSAH